MSSQYLQSYTPTDDINLKVHDLLVRGDTVSSGTTINGDCILTGSLTVGGASTLAAVGANSVATPVITQSGSLSLLQATSITTAIDATTAGDSFEITTVQHELTAGATVEFDVNVASISQFDHPVVSMVGFGGTFLSDGTPIVFLQTVDAGANKFTLGLKNIAVSQSTGTNLYVIQVNIIRGSA
tara:strand:- start:221 stop:772 length:552 start_codon:yes stop_codon:yes gene_type:complete